MPCIHVFRYKLDSLALSRSTRTDFHNMDLVGLILILKSKDIASRESDIILGEVVFENHLGVGEVDEGLLHRADTEEVAHWDGDGTELDVGETASVELFQDPFGDDGSTFRGGEFEDTQVSASAVVREEELEHDGVRSTTSGDFLEDELGEDALAGVVDFRAVGLFTRHDAELDDEGVVFHFYFLNIFFFKVVFDDFVFLLLREKKNTCNQRKVKTNKMYFQTNKM
jgi:hypothetical protein